MAAQQILGVFLVLILAQAAFANNNNNNMFGSEEEEMRKNPTPSQKLLLYTFDNFVSLGKHFASNAANVSRHMLKDESVMANTKPEVMAFKKNLTMFVEQYEAAKSPLLMWDILDIYSNTTDYYIEHREGKITPESEFLVGILKQYDCQAVIVKFGMEFISFMENFMRMFEENKSHLNQPMLDWYEKYNTLEDIDDKIDAIGHFIEMA